MCIRLKTVALLWTLPGLFLATGCDPAFEPLKDNDRYHYSLNGLLDASADTQWIRVMPVRETVRFEPHPLNVTVTLEHPASGQLTALRDTLMNFRGNSPAGGGPAVNYFTSDMDLKPGETYRLSASGPNGELSYAEVTLPNDFPEPRFSGNYMYLDANSIDHFVDATAAFYYINTVSQEVQKLISPKLQSAEIIFTNEYRVNIAPLAPDKNLNAPWRAYKSELFVASGGPDWPPLSTMSDLSLQHPDVISNVHNGVGFIAPIVSKTIPLCQGNPSPYPCPGESEL